MECAASAVLSALKNAENILEDSSNINDNKFLIFRARTARRWRIKLGFSYEYHKQNIYIDNYERQDLIEYRKNIFLKHWGKYAKRFVNFNEDGTRNLPLKLSSNNKPIVFITLDESTFHSNDGKHQQWVKNGKQKLRPKGRGKGIMVSGFLTPGGILRVPDLISDEELLNNSSWPKNTKGKPIGDAIEYIEFGKDIYLT